MQWLHSIVYWHWFIFATLLIILELLFPAFYLLWIGISAGIVGSILFFFPDISLLAQVLIFIFFSVLTLVIYKIYQKRNPMLSEEPMLNRRGKQYLGRELTLTEAIVNGYGKTRVDDSIWKVSGEDLPADTRVRVIEVNDMVLEVEISNRRE